MKKYRVSDGFGILALMLFILTLVIALTIWFIPLYQFSLQVHNVPEQVGMTYETIMENYYVLLEYLHSPFVTELNFPDFQSSASGLFHFYEVKLLFYLNYAVLFISGMGSVIYLRTIWKTKRFYILVKPFFIAIWAPIVLLGFLALSFDRMFVIFHQILFNNEAWLFNPATDPIITVLPQEFFMYCFIFAFLVIEVLLIFGYFYFKKKARRSLTTYE